MSSDMGQTMHDYKSGMEMMSREAGDTMQAFMGFMNSVLCDCVLDTKTKELIALGMAITARCTYCIGIHVNKALHAGVTHAEIIEVCKVAMLMGGGPAMTYIAEVRKALDLFEKQQSA
ncbi:MAG: carboxymuconolactone decarboxylase family protein [Halothiobacillaceae bacterium]|jgi:AhpD family alkylhydroperoxidase|nr:carboxymuconolactone decarboxylase family protein [Halothiobacillaceae bacterium]MDY0049897.1 carboxymuconolactone decarboxylase family protein [Halothiobacillaceae bacterium]